MPVLCGIIASVMQIIYTSHLQFRIRIRNIPFDLPRKVFSQAKEHYYDKLTGHYVAMHKVEFKGKLREMVLTYDRKPDAVEIITIHPIKPYQKISRINSGRWQKYE
jgi:hypothetical protein